MNVFQQNLLIDEGGQGNGLSPYRAIKHQRHGAEDSRNTGQRQLVAVGDSHTVGSMPKKPSYVISHGGRGSTGNELGLNVHNRTSSGFNISDPLSKKRSLGGQKKVASIGKKTTDFIANLNAQQVRAMNRR